MISTFQFHSGGKSRVIGILSLTTAPLLLSFGVVVLNGFVEILKVIFVVDYKSWFCCWSLELSSSNKLMTYF